MAESKFVMNIKSAKRASVPIIAVETQDLASTMRTIGTSMPKGAPLISWDIVDGIRARNPAAKEALVGVLGDKNPALLTNPSEALSKAAEFPDGTVFFMLNAHRFIGSRTTAEASVGQAIWNLRDRYKQNERMLVMLGAGIALPDELKQDVLVFDEPLPSLTELRGVVERIYEQAPDAKKLDEKMLVQATERLRGLSLFSAEQATAMSMGKTGLDLQSLWERKKKQVEQTPGLTIYSGDETFADVEGVPQIKQYLTQYYNGRDPASGIMFMDEIEKMFAGISGDLSGVSQEQHGEFLRWSQDNKIPGIILVGHPGCTKTFIAKCAAGEFGVPMIEANFSAFKASLVGLSGLQTRNALKTILAVMKPLMIATSNSLTNIPPELRRRFKLGTWFFDLPTKAERNAIWKLYLKKYNLSTTPDMAEVPQDNMWTPADIETCCSTAWMLNCSLLEASNYLVPIARSMPEKIQALREQASGKFLNASAPGVYRYEKMQNPQEPGRKLNFSGDLGEA